MKGYKNVLLVFIMACLLVPFIEFQFGLFPLTPLDGDVRAVPDTTLRANTWFNSDYQAVKEKYLNDNFGFRNFYVRLRNEYRYLFFNKVSAKEVVAGRSGYLYEQKYLETHAGMDYVGPAYPVKIFDKVKFVQDTLQKLGIHFAVLFAPGKATFYPEYVPSPYDITTEQTNYLAFTRAAAEQKVNHIDYNKWFLQMKDKAPYPLYPRTGTHWSIYGMHLAFDSLAGYIEQRSGKKTREFDYSNVEMSDSLRHPDGDIAAGLNLLHELPHFTMAYPIVKWTGKGESYKPRVLTVADSYWMGIYFTQLPKEVFSKHEFWYYNKMLYNYGDDSKPGDPSDLDLKTSVEQNDFIFIMATEASLKSIGWGIIDELYDLYKNGPYAYELAKRDRKKVAEMNRIKSIVWGDEKWFAQVKKQAAAFHMSLDSCVNTNAEFFYNETHKNDPPVVLTEAEKMRDRILHIKISMMQNKEWKAHLLEKAKKWGVSLDSCMTVDAQWTAQQDLYRGRLAYFKSKIKSTPDWLKEVEAQARSLKITLDSCIMINARFMISEEQKKK